MKYIKSIIVLLFCAFSGFGQNATDTAAEVLVLSETFHAPIKGKDMGSIKVGDHMFHFMFGYDQAVEAGQVKARKMGGNVLKITEMKQGGMTPGYVMHADIYNVDSLEFSRLRSLDTTEKRLNKTIPQGEKYAIINFYRPKMGNGTLVGTLTKLSIRIDDSVACRLSINTKYAVKVYKQGTINISTSTEFKDNLKLDVTPGKVYFVKLAVGTGLLIGTPNLEWVSTAAGLYDCKSIPFAQTEK